MKLSSGDCVLIGRNQYLVDMKSSTSLTLARPSAPYHRLRVTPTGSTEVSSDASKGSIFVMEGEGEIMLRSSVKHDGKFYYLSLNSSDELCATLSQTALPIQRCSPTSPRILVPHHKRRFRAEGYLHLPQLISPSAVFAAQRCLMYYLGQPGALVAGGAQPGTGKLAGRVSNAPEIQQLLQGTLLQLLHEILGQNNVDNVQNMSAQIALRFPELQDERPKIDGRLWHTDGLRQGKRHPFSLLVGVCLSDCMQEFAGNLLIWPGTHALLHRATRNSAGAVDCDVLEKLHAELLTTGYIADRSALKSDEDSVHINEPSDLTDLGQPQQLLARAGDVVILHPDTAHAGGPNTSCTIRSMVYFRIRHKNLAVLQESFIDDMYVDLPGLKEEFVDTETHDILNYNV